ncbi:hypothetical protein Tco_0280272 [Tanacetum coccineum]
MGRIVVECSRSDVGNGGVHRSSGGGDSGFGMKSWLSSDMQDEGWVWPTDSSVSNWLSSSPMGQELVKQLTMGRQELCAPPPLLSSLSYHQSHSSYHIRHPHSSCPFSSSRHLLRPR